MWPRLRGDLVLVLGVPSSAKQPTDLSTAHTYVIAALIDHYLSSNHPFPRQTRIDRDTAVKQQVSHTLPLATEIRFTPHIETMHYYIPL